MSLLGVLTVALIALVLHRTFQSALCDATGAGWCTVAAVLGTPLFNYATTLFSEPLATLCCALALLQVVRGDSDLAPSGSRADLRLSRVVIAGVMVSIAAASHITALLYIPLLAIYAWRNARVSAGGWWRRAAVAPLVMTLAALPVVAWVCYLNWRHFGSAFETGRGVMPEFWVRGFVGPSTGLYGLTLSPGKGLMWFAPLACLGAAAGAVLWRRPSLPWIARAMLVYLACRLMFLSARADWHAGFGLGSRYMVMALPDFMLVGALAWHATSDSRPARGVRRLAAITAAIALAVAQQFYFASGEIFLFTHRMRDLAIVALQQGRPANVYLDWAYTPLWGLLGATSGPWLYRVLHLDPRVGWILLLEVTAVVALLAFRGARDACPDA
jgi:hypothetical protein